MSEIEGDEQTPRDAPISDISQELRDLAMPPKGYGTPSEVSVAYRILLNHPALVRDLRPIGDFFLRETLPTMRDREPAGPARCLAVPYAIRMGRARGQRQS